MIIETEATLLSSGARDIRRTARHPLQLRGGRERRVEGLDIVGTRLRITDCPQTPPLTPNATKRRRGCNRNVNRVLRKNEMRPSKRFPKRSHNSSKERLAGRFPRTFPLHKRALSGR